MQRSLLRHQANRSGRQTPLEQPNWIQGERRPVFGVPHVKMREETSCLSFSNSGIEFHPLALLF